MFIFVKVRYLKSIVFVQFKKLRYWHQYRTFSTQSLCDEINRYSKKPHFQDDMIEFDSYKGFFTPSCNIPAFVYFGNQSKV